MPLRRVNQPPSYEPVVGIVRFEMEDDGQLVHCMISAWALRGRAPITEDQEPNVERLFKRYGMKSSCWPLINMPGASSILWSSRRI